MLILCTRVRFDQNSMLNPIKQGVIFLEHPEGHFKTLQGHDHERIFLFFFNNKIVV